MNPGAGAPLLARGTPPVGPGVLFDSVVVLFPNGTGIVNLLDGSAAAPLTDVSIDGAMIRASFSTALLPSRGFDFANYTFNLWPRSGLGENVQIADLAPDNSNFAVSTDVPEPAALGLFGLGLLSLGVARRRKA